MKATLLVKYMSEQATMLQYRLNMNIEIGAIFTDMGVIFCFLTFSFLVSTFGMYMILELLRCSIVTGQYWIKLLVKMWLMAQSPGIIMIDVAP